MFIKSMCFHKLNANLPTIGLGKTIAPHTSHNICCFNDINRISSSFYVCGLSIALHSTCFVDLSHHHLISRLVSSHLQMKLTFKYISIHFQNLDSWVALNSMVDLLIYLWFIQISQELARGDGEVHSLFLACHSYVYICFLLWTSGIQEILFHNDPCMSFRFPMKNLPPRLRPLCNYSHHSTKHHHHMFPNYPSPTQALHNLAHCPTLISTIHHSIR